MLYSATSIIKVEINYKNLLIAAIATGVVVLLFKLQTIITVFAVSFFIAYMFDPVVDKFEERKIPRSVTILVMMALTAALIVLLLAWLIPVAASELQYLSNNVANYVDSLFGFVQTSAAVFDIQLDVNTLKQHIGSHSSDYLKEIFSSMSSLMSSFSSMVSVILNIALVPILVFYFLKDFDKILAKMLEFLNTRFKMDFTGYYREFDNILSTYFRGQIIVAAILGLLYTLVLFIAGIKPAVIVGTVSGILSVVPYLGFIVGFTVSVILAALQYGDFLHPTMVIAGFALVQFFEGNFITPRILGGSLGLHPTAVIFSLMAGGALFGIGGMIIALPVAAFLRVLINQRSAQ
ncbi:AI-2E family transporter [Seleniivibrio woodruffii]|uniref:AI-2E family transporter n=1 Tax=Seleniivibrio woodruffii TaxID=1078050 RepID=UPI0011A52A33|nr:AI-2E family transporter [Seleniivibrio woodruffii]TVZ34702.1 putative PurR-regulated permease PerM [Seleniivibrio woodruffii]